MDLQVVDIDMEHARDSIVGGGIVPICVLRNQIHVLLGKERFINHWRGSLKWSGFEGGKKYDEAIEKTVCREFIEESINVVKFFNQESSVPNLMHLIESKGYFERIVLCINHKINQMHEKRMHVTYVVEVPPQPECVTTFHATRASLLNLQEQFVKVANMTAELPDELPFIKENSIVNGNKVKAIIDARITNKMELIVTYLEEEGIHKIRNELTCDTQKDATAYITWFDCRMQITDDLCAFEHVPDALLLERNCLGHFMSGKVNEEYLEKEDIRWWTLSELQTLLENGGVLGRDVCRAYFLPTLQCLLQELQKHQATMSS